MHLEKWNSYIVLRIYYGIRMVENYVDNSLTLIPNYALPECIMDSSCILAGLFQHSNTTGMLPGCQLTPEPLQGDNRFKRKLFGQGQSNLEHHDIGTTVEQGACDY